MLGVTTYQLAFVTPNRTFDLGRALATLGYRLINFAHPPSYAQPQPAKGIQAIEPHLLTQVAN